MNRTEEVLQSINENIKKLTKVLADIDPEIYYDHTRNLLSISVRALIKGTNSFIYGAFMDPDMADVFLTRLCRNPKLIRDRFEIIKILTSLAYDVNTSNFNEPNTINANARNYVRHDLFYFNQYSYAAITNISSKTVDLKIHILNELSGISDHKETQDLNNMSFDVTTRILTPSGDETISVEEHHECTLNNIPISNFRDEIIKATETITKHSKIIAIDKLLRTGIGRRTAESLDKPLGDSN